MRREWQPPREGTGTTLDEIYVALSHRQRRFIIYELCQSDSLELGELADRLVDWNRLGTVDCDRNALLSSLQRTHIPVLEHADIVEYDTDAERVTLASTGRQAEEVRRLAITQAQK